MAYYTTGHLQGFFEALVEDIIKIEKDGTIKTTSGFESPVGQLAKYAFDRMWEGFMDEDGPDDEEGAEIYAHNHFKEEMMYYLTSNIDDFYYETEDPIGILNTMISGTGHSYVDMKLITPENVWAWIAHLPLPWVHEKILQINGKKN